MALTVLHTSDWHLGASLETASREEEQRRFLDWLLEVLEERRVDLLLVAGDVFHHAQPSAEALSLYYRFLARLGETGVTRAVIVGGNHDSPSRLDAPRELLGALAVDVVGGLSSASEIDRCLVPVEIDGDLRAVVAAVPFVHEFRLGVRTTGVSPGEIAQRVGEVFGDLYGQLAAKARELSADVPVLAMGHLTVGRPADGVDTDRDGAGDDFETPIHQVGGVTSLPPSLFGGWFAYVALGHIHRAYPLDGAERRIWYSGSPVALSVPESRHPRKVLLVEVGDQMALDGLPGVTVEQIPVPVTRRIVPVRGSLEEVLEQLGEIEPGDDGLQPYAVVDLEVDGYRPGDTAEIHRAVAELPEERRPRVVKVTQRRVGGGPGLEREERILPGRLAELDPEAVFVRLVELESGGAPPSDELLAAFRAVASQRAEDGDDDGDGAGDGDGEATR